jgi:hypothetical protein
MTVLPGVHACVRGVCLGVAVQPTQQRQCAALFMVLLDRLARRSLECGELDGGAAALAPRPINAQDLMAAVVSHQKGRGVGSLDLRHYDMCRILYEVSRQKGVPLDMGTMVHLARFFGAHPGTGLAHARMVLQDVRSRGMGPTCAMLEAVVDVYMQHGCVEDTLPLLKEMKLKYGLPEDVRTHPLCADRPVRIP